MLLAGLNGIVNGPSIYGGIASFFPSMFLPAKVLDEPAIADDLVFTHLINPVAGKIWSKFSTAEQADLVDPSQTYEEKLAIIRPVLDAAPPLRRAAL